MVTKFVYLVDSQKKTHFLAIFAVEVVLRNFISCGRAFHWNVLKWYLRQNQECPDFPKTSTTFHLPAFLNTFFSQLSARSLPQNSKSAVFWEVMIGSQLLQLVFQESWSWRYEGSSNCSLFVLFQKPKPTLPIMRSWICSIKFSIGSFTLEELPFLKKINYFDPSTKISGVRRSKRSFWFFRTMTVRRIQKLLFETENFFP